MTSLCVSFSQNQPTNKYLLCLKVSESCMFALPHSHLAHDDHLVIELDYMMKFHVSELKFDIRIRKPTVTWLSAWFAANHEHYIIQDFCPVLNNVALMIPYGVWMYGSLLQYSVECVLFLHSVSHFYLELEIARCGHLMASLLPLSNTGTISSVRDRCSFVCFFLL